MVKALEFDSFGLLRAHAQLLVVDLVRISHCAAIGRLALLQRVAIVGLDLRESTSSSHGLGWSPTVDFLNFLIHLREKCLLPFISWQHVLDWLLLEGVYQK